MDLEKLVNQTVSHKYFGKGIIRSVNDNNKGVWKQNISWKLFRLKGDVEYV